MLLDERAKQAIELGENGLVAANLEGAVLFDGAYSLFADVAADDAGESAAQIGGQVRRPAGRG